MTLLGCHKALLVLKNCYTLTAGRGVCLVMLCIRLRRMYNSLLRAYSMCIYCLMGIVLCIPLAAVAGPVTFADVPLHFSVYRMGTESPTALVVGGIQGDEPGGFSAATLLVTRYTVLEGALWVVPNLNFPSIIRRSRGLYGDMNRKFAVLAATDPEFAAVNRIQELIRSPEVNLVLNLHDGSGYYRRQYEGPLYNPSRWGQSIIVDQSAVGAYAAQPHPLHQLETIAETIVRKANTRLLAPGHRLHVRNTRTAEGDREMEKSLSWYAVRHGKAAFGLEASKEFSVEVRAYYHLLMVEQFLAAAGVRVTRDFPLTPHGVRAALQSDVNVAFAGNRIMLPLEDARPHINLLPLPRGNQAVVSSKPIMAVLSDAGTLNVHYGNRTVTRIRPEWREMDDSLNGVRVLVDGEDREISFGQVVDVREQFLVRTPEGYRVNAIGMVLPKGDQSGVTIRHASFMPRFSVDRQGTLFRIEVYRGQHFSGMFLARFGGKPAVYTRRDILPGARGRESSLGY